jgi:hypothetical protein
MKTSNLRIAALVPAMALVFVLPTRVRATETTAKIESNVAEARGDAAKAAIDDLDREIDRVDAMIDNAPTPADKASAKARMDVLKERRSDLRKTYAKAKYDELKADIRAEGNRVSAWGKDTFHRDPAKKAANEMKDAAHDAKKDAKEAGNNAYAYANSAGATMDLAAYKMRPTDTNRDEAKAALKALDKKIDELDDRADKMPKGPDRDAAKRRVKALEDRKDQLKHEFNKARFDALVDDVQSAWN